MVLLWDRSSYRDSFTISVKVLAITSIVLASTSRGHRQFVQRVNASSAPSHLPAISSNLINIDQTNLSADVNQHTLSTSSTNPANSHHSTVQDVLLHNQHHHQHQQQQDQQQHQMLSTSSMINSIGQNNQAALEQAGLSGGESVSLDSFADLNNESPNHSAFVVDSSSSETTNNNQSPHHQAIERRFGLFKKGASAFNSGAFPSTGHHYGGSNLLMNDCERCLASMGHQASTNADLQSDSIPTMPVPGIPFMQPFSPLKNKLFIKFPLLKPIPFGDSFSSDASSPLWSSHNLHYQQHSNRLPSLASSMFQPIRPFYNCIQSPPIVATSPPLASQEQVSGKLKTYQQSYHSPTSQY